MGTSSLLRQDKNCIHLSQVCSAAPRLARMPRRRAHARAARQMTRLCEAVAALHDAGHRVVLVSSGAVGAGCQRLGASHP